MIIGAAMKLSDLVLRIPERVDSTKMDDSVIVLEPSTGQYLSLNRVAARFWELVDENGEVSKAIAALLKEYDVDEQRLRLDLESLVDELLDLHLLEVVGRRAR